MLAHVLITCNQTGRRIDQTTRHADLLGPAAQRRLQTLDQGLLIHLINGGFFCRSGIASHIGNRIQVHITPRNAGQLLATEFGQVPHHPLVHAFRQQQDLNALLAEDLQVRTGLGGRQRVGGDIPDRVLTFFHAANVVGQRHRIALALG